MDMVQSYIEMTNALVETVGATHAMMHIHAGLALYLGAQLLMRTRRASIVALGLVTVVTLLHEVMDRLHYGDWRWADTSGDIVLTLFWPAAITFVGLYRRKRWKLEQARRHQIALTLQQLFTRRTRGTLPSQDDGLCQSSRNALTN